MELVRVWTLWRRQVWKHHMQPGGREPVIFLCTTTTYKLAYVQYQGRGKGAGVVNSTIICSCTVINYSRGSRMMCNTFQKKNPLMLFYFNTRSCSFWSCLKKTQHHIWTLPLGRRWVDWPYTTSSIHTDRRSGIQSGWQVLKTHITCKVAA